MFKSRATMLAVGVLAVFVVGVAAQLYASSNDSCNTFSIAGDGQSTCAKTKASCASSATSGDDCQKACSASCTKKCRGKGTKSASIEEIDLREGRRVVLTGHYVCGACDLGYAKKCQAAFQTAGGKNYLLAKNHLSKELHKAARDKDVEIVTRVKKYDGVKYLEVEVIRPL